MYKEQAIKKINQSKVHYMIFDSLMELDAFVKEEIRSRLSLENKKVWQHVLANSGSSLKDPDWFGTPVAKNIAELEEHKEFQKPELFQEVENEIRNSLSELEKLELLHPMQRKKIAYNSMGFGVFSFDRAAMGLQKIKTESGEKITTSVREVYAYFQNKPIEQKSVKLYIVAGGNAFVKARDMLYNGMGAVVIADYLMQRNYGVEINIIIESLSGLDAYMNVIRVKNFEDSLDRNLIAVLTSDPKYYRFKGFKGIVSCYNAFNQVCPGTLGGMVPADLINKFIKEGSDNHHGSIQIRENYNLSQISKSIVEIIQQLKRKEHAGTE